MQFLARDLFRSNEKITLSDLIGRAQRLGLHVKLDTENGIAEIRSGKGGVQIAYVGKFRFRYGIRTDIDLAVSKRIRTVRECADVVGLTLR